MCEQHKHGSVGAGAGNRPGYPTRVGAARRELAPRAELAEEVNALLPDELIDELLAGARRRRRSPVRVACWVS